MNKIEDQFSLEKFSPLIAELESKASMYMSLTINWIDDKENQQVVQKAKMEVVRLRTSIEKFAKEIRYPHTKFNKLVSEKEKELIWKIDPVEKHLKAEQEKIEQELKRIEEEEKEKAKKIFEERIKKLSEIKCIPDNLFAIWNMTDDEFNLYYQTKSEEAYQKDLIQIWLNMISSCTTLQELEDLHHDETFLETYQTQQFKEAFEKRFNEINNEIKRQNELLISSLIRQIYNTKTIEELEGLKYPNPIPEELEDIINDKRKSIEQQEELNKIKTEQEEKRKQEEEEQKKKQQEEEQKKKLKETRRVALVDKINSIQTEEELKELYFKEDMQDLIPEVKHIFTERKNEILERVKQEQQQKEFQDYLQSINYNKEDCIIKKEWQETLIYKLIGKWNK